MKSPASYRVTISQEMFNDLRTLSATLHKASVPFTEAAGMVKGDKALSDLLYAIYDLQAKAERKQDLKGNP